MLLTAVVATYTNTEAEHAATMAELAKLGRLGTEQVSPLWCEVCGTTLEYREHMVPVTAEFVVPLAGGDYLRCWQHGTVLVLRYDNPLCCGEATGWGAGLGGECDCTK